MRIGLFGGSFDPVHLGHLELARQSQRQARLDEVWFLPAATQPLKRHGPQATDDQRCAMLELAIADEPTWRVSRLELDRGGVSYTVDTLRHVHAEMPDAELFFLMGADTLADLPRWHEPEAILRLTTPLVAHRAGEPPPDFASLAQVCSLERVREIEAAKVEMPAMPISSTEIRARAERGEGLEGLVPEGIEAFIKEKELYGDS